MNQTILEQNICNSLWYENEAVSDEAIRIFMQLKTLDKAPYYAAEDAARLWLKAGKFLRPFANDDVLEFIAKRIPSLFGFDNFNIKIYR